MRTLEFLAMLVASGLVGLSLAVAQAQVSDENLDSISIPDKVETSIGTLDFFDGVRVDVPLRRFRLLEEPLQVGKKRIGDPADNRAKASKASAPDSCRPFRVVLRSAILPASDPPIFGSYR
jgi:hypothetical protein